MSLIERLAARLFGKEARLDAEQRRRLDAWRELAEPDLGAAHLLQRHVVVDVESSGLDIHRDRLIAIGAIAVSGSRIAYGDSFHAVLRQDQASSDANILVHGIGDTAQSEGDDPVEVLLRFLEFSGKSPLVGFHAPFDEAMISKATRSQLGHRFNRNWLDLAWLCPAIVPLQGRRLNSLDDWMSAFDVVNLSRHNALADALATAQIFQVLQQRAAVQGMRSTRELLEAARSQEWLTRRKR